jgi:hypothetical protein
MEISILNASVEEDKTTDSYVRRKHKMYFDKLKICVPCDAGFKPFKILDKDAFKHHIEDGREYWVYDRRKNEKINLHIWFGETSEHKHVIIIEITSAILQSQKMELLHADNIQDVLRSLETYYHILQIIDMKYFIENAYVYKCDITKDLFLTKDSARMLRKFTLNNRRNTRRTKVDLREDVNFILENKVKSSSENKLRVVFYDKYLELQQEKRYGRLPIGFDIEKFAHSFRIEANLKNPNQIMKYLKIRDNKLSSVLSNKAQPILTIYNELIQFPRPQNIQDVAFNSLKEHGQYLLAKHYNFNLKKIEEELRRYRKPWRTIYLQPYIDICNGRGVFKNKMETIIKKVKDMLTIKYEECRKYTNLVA